MRTLRWTGTVALLLVAAVLALTAVTARFARSEILDTDRYVATVAPLASNPAVQDAVTTRVTDKVMESANIPALVDEAAAAVDVKGASKLADLATPAIASWVSEQVNKVVGDVVRSPEFATIWTNVNRTAHSDIDKILTGKGGATLSTDNGDIVIDLGSILSLVRTQLTAKGWAWASRIPETSIPYTVAHVESLPKIQRAVKFLNAAAVALPILALAALLLAAWCAPNHRRGLLIGLLIIAGTMAVALTALVVARNQYADWITQNGRNAPAALAVWDAVTVYLRIAIRTLLVVTLLGALWAYLSGPSRAGRLFRTGVNRLIEPITRRVGPHPILTRLASRWQNWVTLGAGGLGIWWLLRAPTVATAVTITVLAALGAAGFSLVRHLPSPSRSSRVGSAAI